MIHAFLIICIIIFNLHLNAEETDTQNNKKTEKEHDDLKKRVKQLEKDIDKLKRRNSNKTNPLETKKYWGQGVNFEISHSLHGSYFSGSLGVFTPKILSFLNFGMKLYYMQNYYTRYLITLENYNRNWPSLLMGSFAINLGLPLVFNHTRLYGGVEFIMGFPVGDYVIVEENSVKKDPDSHSFGRYLIQSVYGYGGVEIYATNWFAFFTEIGGGAMFQLNTTGEKNDPIVTEDMPAGSGFMLKIGTRFYIPEKKKVNFNGD